MCYNYLWQGDIDYKGFHWVKWQQLADPKSLGGWGLKHSHRFGLSLPPKSLWSVLTKDSLWRRFLVQQYIAPSSLVDSGSLKPMESLVPFPPYHRPIPGLASGKWHSNKDWSRCHNEVQQKYPSPRVLVLHLQEIKKSTLNTINKPEETSVWKQGWLSAVNLTLNGNSARLWELYVNELRRAHIRLTKSPNELIWSYNKVGGDYSVRLGYKALSTSRDGIAYWWWKALWKVEAPKKSKLLLWLALSDKVLIRDHLQRRSKDGRNRCTLCRMHPASNLHFFKDCPFTGQV
jgi:hypothetical protein